MSASFEYLLYQPRRILLPRSLKKCSKMITCVTLMMICFNSLCYCFTCSASSSNSYLITSDQCSFTGYIGLIASGVASGPVSNSLYYSGNPLIVVRLGASTGSIVDAQNYSFLTGSHESKTHLLSDGSGYYVTGQDASLRANICKYLFTSSTTSQCQQIINAKYNLCGQIKLSEVTFFMLGQDISAPNNLHIYKHTFGNTPPDWSLTMACPSSTCAMFNSESQLVSSSIYTFFVYGNPKYLYIAVVSLSDGSVSSRYKSSTACYTAYGSAVSGDYIAVSTLAFTSELLLFNRVTNSITIKSFSASALYEVGLEPLTNRLVVLGSYINYGYITKFMPESLSAHPNFQTTASWTMGALASGTEDIVADSGQTIGAVTSQSVTSTSYTNVSVTYVLVTSYNSDVSYYTSSQTYIYGKNTYVQVIPDLTCSTTGITSITYSLASYNGNVIPAWITINSSTGQLSITTPSPSTNTDYSFYISSTISGVSSAVNKLMTISISGCTTSNCLICQPTDVSTCTTCNSGYTLSSGQCSIISSSQSSSSSQNSASSSINDNENLKIDSEVSKNFVITAFIISCSILVVSNTLFSTSMSSIWVMINQIQLYFLLFLTRAFIPDQIKKVIIGMNFCLNPFPIIPPFDPQFYGELLNKLYFNVDNPELSYFKINSASTIYNAFSIISCLIFTAILHILFYVLHRSSSNWSTEGRCAKLKRMLKYIFKKIFEILTFAIYIRYILELSQFFMVSSISEIYSFDTSGYLRIISVVFAIIVLVFFTIVTVSLFLFAFSSYKEIEGEHNKLSELISGLKPNRIERFYVSFLMTRRLIFIMVLIFSGSLSSQIVIGMLIAFQAPYLIYLFLIRPYKEMDTTIIELLNECIFIILLITLIILNSERDWTPLLAHIYMQVICFNSLMSSVVVSVFFIISVCKWCKGRKITRVQPIHRIEENQSSIENMAEIQNIGASQRIAEKKEESKEESKEDEKVEKPEDDLKPQNLDDSLNIDDIFPHKN